MSCKDTGIQVIHPEFLPALHWLRAYEKQVDSVGVKAETLRVSIVDGKGHGSSVTLSVLPEGKKAGDGLTKIWLEKVVKMLLWQRGGCQIWLNRRGDLVEHLRSCFRENGKFDFDWRFFSEEVYQRPMEILLGEPMLEGAKQSPKVSLESSTRGCRIGYDLGGSDRKCAAIIDGEVVHSEEIQWDPYHQKDPHYHIEGVRDSLKRAAAHLPRVDAIGGSSAGVIVDDVPQVGSLFRGLSSSAMQESIRPFFRGLSAEWGNIPVTLLNDGEVTALAGASWLGKKGVMGLAMGTSLAAGYVDPEGNVGQYLNELAFCPVDFGSDAALDEWSGDRGCGVQYFSQQAAFRLAMEAGISVPSELNGAPKLKYLQNLAEEGDICACSLFCRMGTYLGQTLPFWKRFYDFDHLLLLGRVVSGVAGDCIIENAKSILREHASDPLFHVEIHVPDETFKRHGQAIVAASIPSL